MKFTILLVSLFVSISLISQGDWASEYALMEEFYNSDDNDLAIKHSNNALALAKKEFGSESLEYGLTKQFIGIVYFSQDEVAKSESSLKSAKNLFITMEGEKINVAITSYLLGALYLETDLYEKAETELLEAGGIFEESDEIANVYYGLVLDELATLYYRQGENEVALDIYESLTQVQILQGSVKNPELTDTYNKIGMILLDLSKFNRVEEVAYKSITNCEANGLVNSLSYEKALGILGLSYINNNNQSLGESLIMDCKREYQKRDMKGDPFYYKLLIGLGQTNQEMGFYGEAYNYLTIGKELYAKNDWDKKDYLQNLNLLFRTFLETGDYDQAADYLQEIITINASLKEFEEVSINNLQGILAYKQGDLKKAENYFKKTIPSESEKIDTKGIEYLNNYANVLCDLGNFEKAESSYLRVLESIENNPASNIENYISVLNNLALLYLDRGNYYQTEILMNECVSMSKKVYGVASNEFALSLNNIGVMYFEIGNYDLAVEYFIQASDLYRENFGEKSIQFASLESNIAMLFSTIGEHDEALRRLEKVRSIEGELLGDKNLNAAENLLNIAGEYLLLGNTEEAANKAKESAKIISSLMGEQCLDYASANKMLGQISFKDRKYETSIKYSELATTVYKNVLGENNIDYARSLIQLASSNLASKNKDVAARQFAEARNILNSNLDDVFAFLSEQEKEKFLMTMNSDFNSFFTFAVEESLNTPELGGDVFEQSVKLKGLLLKSSSVMRNTIFNGTDEELKDKYNKWISTKKRIADLYASQSNLKSDKLTKLEEEANLLEKELYQSVNLSKSIDNEKLENWQLIQNKLNPQDVVLDFISYKNEYSDEIEYAVIILNDTASFPKVVKLFNEKEVKAILGEYGANNYEYIKNIYGDAKTHKNELYSLIWEPIEKEIVDKKNIYISPTGVLHRISLWALGSDPEKLMIDLYNIQNLSTSLNLIDPPSVDRYDLANVSIFGDIKYNTPSTEEEHWKYLEGTAEEVEGLEKSFKSKSFNTTVIRGLEASETSFKENAVNSNLIHVATHGFFFPDPEQLVAQAEVEDIEDVGFRGSGKVVGLSSFTHNKNPLMRSGLIFAGVNDLWNKDKYAKKDDGVLTAYEVTQMDFKNTKLVVLSACETGLGEISGNEGVYGLQRALKMHEIPYIINSLWQVPDKETQEFMNFFYEELLTKNLEVKEAFNNARKEMRSKYSPFFWGAFVLIQ